MAVEAFSNGAQEMPEPCANGEVIFSSDLKQEGTLLSREHLKPLYRASLVAQWLRICLPMQGNRVRALVWEDPTCRGATKPVSHNH